MVNNKVSKMSFVILLYFFLQASHHPGADLREGEENTINPSMQRFALSSVGKKGQENIFSS